MAIWAWLAALAGTVGYGLGSVLQGAAARRGGGPAVLVRPAYIAGVACDLLAWVASLVALQRLPLFTVQALLAGSLAVTVLLARAFLGARLAPRDGAAIAVVVLALAVTGASAGAEAAGSAPTWLVTALLVTLLVSAAVTGLRYRGRHPITLAISGGVAFSGAAFGARGLQTGGGLLPLLSEPALWLIVALGVVGALAYARSLEVGAIGPVTAVLWVIEIVLPGAAGVAFLGDQVRPGWTVPALVAVGAAIAGCVALAASPAQAAAEAAGPAAAPDAS
ncbi:hypothetical protein [Cumulibacter manganitolerans]|uniref:hypothetical protein n=1 Tax=Cumulibacter manganitolerans TaxID=1884992 RepID=UPI00129690B5|nr:hypothetical protein [Cumulibacter manganitolerans]